MRRALRRRIEALEARAPRRDEPGDDRGIAAVWLLEEEDMMRVMEALDELAGGFGAPRPPSAANAPALALWQALRETVPPWLGGDLARSLNEEQKAGLRRVLLAGGGRPVEAGSLAPDDRALLRELQERTAQAGGVTPSPAVRPKYSVRPDIHVAVAARETAE